MLSEAIAGNAATAGRARSVEADVVAGRVLPHSAARALVSGAFARLDGHEASP
jgi:hypothetical protein